MSKKFILNFNYFEDCWHNYDLFIPYVVVELFSKVEHIELTALCVYFEGFIAKTTLQPKINSYK